MALKYHNVPNISVETALEAVRQALAVAKKIGVSASVSVVDRSMNLVAFGKADGAIPHSIDTSRKKANTAASTGKVTGWMSKDLAASLPLASNNKLTNIRGGVPIRFEGELVGGLGVAGGTEEQDRVIAEKAAQAIGADK